MTVGMVAFSVGRCGGRGGGCLFYMVSIKMFFFDQTKCFGLKMLCFHMCSKSFGVGVFLDIFVSSIGSHGMCV